MSKEATQFTWPDFYSEFADKLLVFEHKRPELISRIQKVFEEIGIKLPKLDTNGVPDDIDPFTIFGLFNKQITWANRKKIVAGMASEFGVTAAKPEDFLGIPLMNNLNATFYAFTDNPKRGAGDIDRLWDVFRTAIAYADNPSTTTRAEFSTAYDSILPLPGIKWKITIGLFWIRPYSFVNLDSPNRWFLSQPENVPEQVVASVTQLKEVPTAPTYLKIRDLVLEAINSDNYAYKTIPELSARAWKEFGELNDRKREKEKAAQEQSLGDADVEVVHYWLYAPGKDASMWEDFLARGIMALGWHELDDLSQYESKEDMRLKLQEVYGDQTSQRNPALALWQFSREIKPGDVIYAKRGRNEILGRGIVRGDYTFDSAGGDFPHIRVVEWTDSGSWKTKNQFAMKTLTDRTDFPDFLSEVESFFVTGEDDIDAVEERVIEYPEYSREEFLDEVFMDENKYDTLTGVLKSKKNIILQGAPGVGKTFVAKRLAYTIMGVKDVSRVQMVQFHQSYSYEDFIEGYRPNEKGFNLEKGTFYNFCKRAQDDEDNDYFFIIDEINRGNISRIFGELLMLIENDKRGPKNKIRLLYSGDLLYVPRNLYIVGMMNTADRSLAMLDYAMRRRFAFFDLVPGFDSEGFREHQTRLDNRKFDELVRTVKELNDVIAEDESLGEGFRIGHSYLTGLDPDDAIDEKLSAIVEYEIVPMLKEYWFDDLDKAREWANRLRDAIR